MLRTIQTMLAHQILIYKKTPRSGNKAGISIPDRIVNIFKDYVRSIPGGKPPVATEFGAKVFLELCGGCMRVLDITHCDSSIASKTANFIWDKL